MKLKINNLKDNDKILWKKIPCQCVKDDTLNSYPIKDCLHCKYQKCEDSMPRNSFKIIETIMDSKGNPTSKTKEREIKEITIVRGSHDDIIGWQM